MQFKLQKPTQQDLYYAHIHKHSHTHTHAHIDTQCLLLFWGGGRYGIVFVPIFCAAAVFSSLDCGELSSKVLFYRNTVGVRQGAM